MVKKAPRWQKGKDADLMERIRDRWDLMAQAEESQRQRMLENLAFLAPDGQWGDEERQQREDNNQPCITIDRTTPIIHQIVNEQRQNRPAIQVSPVGDGADVETAEIFQGIIRHVEYQSKANIAYDTCFESGVRCGIGYLRVNKVYAGDDSFQQELEIKRIPNPLCVYYDPNCVEPDFSDAQDCFVVGDMSLREFKVQFPNAAAADYSRGEWISLGNQLPDWFNVGEDGQGTVRVAEYWERVPKRRTICLLPDGTVVEEKDVPEGVKPMDTRTSVSHTVIWRKICGTEVLETVEWDGRWIPIVPMLGDELIVDNDKYYLGVVDRCKDPQRVFNYYKSQQVLTIALAPKAPWIGPRGFMGNRKDQWAQANSSNISALEYEYQTLDGRPLPPPRRDMAEPNIQALTVATAGSIDDIKATTGMFDASMGAKEADQSGRAIRALQQQGATGNYHFADNMNRTLVQVGKILVDLIPKVYDTPQVRRIVRDDGTVDMVPVNMPTGKRDPKTGVEQMFRLDVGRYDVVVSSGPSFQTKRAENVAMLSDLFKSNPQFAAVGADLLVREMDMQISQQLADRLKRAMDPKVVGEEDGQVQIPPQAQQAIQQAQKVVDALTAELNAVHNELDKQRLDNETRLRIAEMDNATKLKVAELQAATKTDIAHLEAVMAHIDAVARRLETLADRPLPALAEAPAGAPTASGPEQGITPQPPIPQAEDASEEAA